MLFKLLLLQLGFTCSTAAEKLRFIFSYSQCLRAFNRSFPLFLFFGCLLQKAEICHIYEKYPFLVFFGATNGNFTEKYSITPS